jgi:hypothetical protein
MASTDSNFLQLLFDEPQIIEIVANGLAQFSGVEFQQFHDPEIELMDITILRFRIFSCRQQVADHLPRSTELVLLISYASPTESSTDMSRRTHTLVKLVFQNEKVSVTQIQDLPYRIVSGKQYKSHPFALLILQYRTEI